jgi:pyridoxine kinase
MSILSIQSHVAYGHVGNSAAVFLLQRLGHEVWAVNTVEFSNHLGYDGYRGRILDPGLVDAIVTGIAERGAFARCRAVLTGYLGDEAIGEVALAALGRVRAASPGALYACDPVIGDDGAPYVRPGLAEFLRERVVPAADLVFPNQFELETLTATVLRSVDDVVAAARRLAALGPRLVVCTSFRDPSSPGNIDAVATSDAGAWRVRVGRLPLSVHGTGDAFAAMFLGRYLERPDAARALALTVASLCGVLKATLAAGAAEMCLVAAQDEIVKPTLALAAERIA